MIALVVPCYNERTRLNLKAFAEASGPELQILFVDDGSTDETVSMILEFIAHHENMHVFAIEKNGGKAAAVRAGMLYIAADVRLNTAEWVGYWDADLATPLWEIGNMLRFAEMYQFPVDSIWGSRIYRLGSHIVRSPHRHYLGRGFATLISFMLHAKSYDSQCGAKLFRHEHLQTAFAEPFLSNWIFDLEILLRFKGLTLIEYPLRQWQDVPGSKVKIFREIARVFLDILRIRKKYLS
ncbi:MAG: glycosyltransferase [Proteobacteria bacterium]|nr:MAG: glycosyltransferase [Pseudomonadota bacterium]